MQLREFRAMNTSVLLALDGEGRSDEGLRETQAFIEECEQRFSRFLPDSELSQLNATAGEWVEVSPELLSMLQLSKAYYEETAGLFDPSILPDLKRAGYDASLEVVQRRADTAAHTAPRQPRPPFSALELAPERSAARLPQGLQLDLGGIAKGWIVEQAALRLRAHGAGAAVNAGGDMFFAGMPMNDDKWQVAIEDPRDASRIALRLGMGEGAVVTSSVSKRTWKSAGAPRHHIIDPRTGEPAETAWLSTTVIAPHAHLAEAYAKALLVGGAECATRLMLQRPRLAVLCIDPGGQVLVSPNGKEYVDDSFGLFQ